MDGETPEKSKYMSTAVLAQLELNQILQHSDVQTRFSLLADFQSRTGQCVEDCVRENVPVCRALYQTDKKARAEIEKLYTDYSAIFELLGIEDSKKD